MTICLSVSLSVCLSVCLSKRLQIRFLIELTCKVATTRPHTPFAPNSETKDGSEQRLYTALEKRIGKENRKREKSGRNVEKRKGKERRMIERKKG